MIMQLMCRPMLRALALAALLAGSGCAGDPVGWLAPQATRSAALAIEPRVDAILEHRTAEDQALERIADAVTCSRRSADSLIALWRTDPERFAAWLYWCHGERVDDLGRPRLALDEIERLLSLMGRVR